MSSRAWTPNSRRWQVAPPFEGAQDLARQIGTSPLVAGMLHNRGINDPSTAKAFLSPRLTDLHDPSLLSGADEAAKRIAAAIAAKKRIVIYGDYDVDGITAVAIMDACLKMLGAGAKFYVPHRLDEGYGVNEQALAKIVADGADLIITVDCGISDRGAIAKATAAGVEVIVTDHHSLPGQLPEGCTIVHPAVGGYPNADLSGSGVAFKLAWQLARAVCGNSRVDQPMKDFLLDATSLAALGTIADVVPLVGENRVLATFGLRGLSQSNLPGIAALLESAGLAESKLDAYDVGFRLAPRLNAAGRMGHAMQAVELLTNASPERAREIAADLDAQNSQRQKVERAIAQQAIQMVETAPAEIRDAAAIVLACDQWHGGVIGIVASRLVERFNRPAIMIAINGDGCGQGSGRSVSGFNLAEALAACSTHLLSHGGHAMAGGLRVQAGQIEAFADAFRKYAAQHIPADRPAEPLAIDAETTAKELSFNVVEHITRLAPFGQGNPPPLVALRGCRLLSAPRRIGRSGQTVSLLLSSGEASIRAVGFGMGDLADSLAGVNRLDVAARPVLNSFNGATNVELQLADVIRD
ncbi:MAG: single-stranded-DNA-specific exonuclease RecJ [Planctomycetes bacterium]|nr:single-stranded-DNA-specific exonuclease RecJ [Planctomycetota bacterium]